MWWFCFFFREQNDHCMSRTFKPVSQCLFLCILMKFSWTYSVTNTVSITLADSLTVWYCYCGPHSRLRQDLYKENLHSYLFLSLLHILLYTSLLILDLRAEKKVTNEKISHTMRYKTTAFVYFCDQCVVVHTCWFCLNRVRASWSMYFLSTSVSLVTPLCACQVRAMRNTRMYSDSTVLWVEAVIGAQKQQLPSQ